VFSLLFFPILFCFLASTIVGAWIAMAAFIYLQWQEMSSKRKAFYEEHNRIGVHYYDRTDQ
jgi:predicted membrane protein